MLSTHTGLLLDAVGLAGVESITTFTEPGAEVQPFTEMVTLYVPLIAVVKLVLVGFC